MHTVRSKYIKIEKPRISKNRTVFSKISCSRNIEKYFLQKAFFAQYDCDIQEVSSSILQIPVFSNIITIAWAVGADVYIGELDESYLRSLDKIKAVMKGWYPKLSFSTDIHVEKTVSSKFSSKRYGLLFSGGIDSTTSYIVHEKQRPNLVMVWGADIPLGEEEFWRRVRNKYIDFAKREKVEINFIKTNLHEFVNEGVLDVDFGRYLTGSWWGSIHHGLAILGLCAPLSIARQIGTLFIASSTGMYPKIFPWGSHWLIDNELSWADVKVEHDVLMRRQEKVASILKNYIETKAHYPFLRVCYSQFHDFNCGRCEKCSRSIASLILENIDADKCGFNVDDRFFDSLKKDLVENRLISIDNTGIWRDIQEHIPETIDFNLHNSKEFFNWLRDFNVVGRKGNGKFSLKWAFLFIFYKLPRSVRQMVAKNRSIARFFISL